MITKKEYEKNLNNKIITGQMLCDALYSANKRAKNYRDKRDNCHHSNWRDSAIENMEKFYHKKDSLLTVIQPSCIHKIHRTKKCRELKEEYIGKEDFYIYSYDEYCFDYYEYEYDTLFLFYDCLKEYGHTFHHPIDEIPYEYKDLEVIAINGLYTYGDNVKELMSVQFINKLCNLVASGDYTYSG